MVSQAPCQFMLYQTSSEASSAPCCFLPLVPTAALEIPAVVCKKKRDVILYMIVVLDTAPSTHSSSAKQPTEDLLVWLETLLSGYCILKNITTQRSVRQEFSLGATQYDSPETRNPNNAFYKSTDCKNINILKETRVL